jgi:hypothetical protein
MKRLRNPELVGRSLHRSYKNSSHCDLSVRGLRKFLIFCVEFDSFLARLASAPKVQASFWWYHAYWFAHLRKKTGNRLSEALDEMAGWLTGGEPALLRR